MVARLGAVLHRFASRWVPDPFVLALGLTGLVAAVAMIRVAVVGAPGESGPLWTVAGGWLDGFASTGGLAFALQMCLVLVTGQAIVESPPVQKLIVCIAGLPRSAAAASALVAMVTCAAAIIHWGVGAIAGALLAREVGRHAEARGIKLHYPLMGAAAYTGMAVWHGGLSGSAPLKVAEPGGAFVAGTVPITDTLLSPLNFVVTLTLLVAIPALFYWLTPRQEDELIPPAADQIPPLAARTAKPEAKTPAAWLQESRIPGITVGVLGLLVVIVAVAIDRITFDINTVNLLFLFSGLLLQARIRNYVDAIASGARGAGAIILQFPFYFGIIGIMQASGVAAWISEGLAAAASQNTFPVLAFYSAGLLNLFVPSGGGQWAVQGEILMTAGNSLGVDPGVTVMAFSYGDAWTNMLQPFWALPLLGIMGLRAKDIIGYTAVVFLLMGAIVTPLLLVLG